jgi:adenine-specific DNA-methyltransferase
LDTPDFYYGINNIKIIKNQVIQEYIKKLPPFNLSEDVTGEIYHYLRGFFSRYYHSGNFSTHENSMLLNNKDSIVLQWANKDQYYVKSLDASKNGKKIIGDYFIHNNLKGYLEKELDLFIKDEVIGFKDLDAIEVAALKLTLEKAKNIKIIALQVIELLSTIETFQLKLWNKIPLVLRTDYVITLDKIEEYAGSDFLNRIIGHVLNNKEQLKEWGELFKINLNDTSDLLEQTGKIRDYLESLAIDTRYFDEDFKWELMSKLSENNNIDCILDGTLIKSDNFQALTFIMKKWGKKVKLIYIDPPFNTGGDGFLYKNDYLDSSWLVMMFNRLDQAKDILNKNGNIFVRIDNNGNHYTRFLLDLVFGKSNFRNEILVNKTRAKQQRKKPFIQQTESLFFYSKSDGYYFNKLEIPRKEPKWYELLDFPRPNKTSRTVLGKEYYPPNNRRWGLSQERISQFESNGKIRINKNKSYIDCFGNIINEKPELFYDTEPVRNDWLDIPGYSQVHKFSTENSEELLQRVIESGSREEDVVLDFFLGSGTTIAAAHKLNRKWIGVEMGTQFENFVLPRMKSVLKGEKSGISKTIDPKKSGFFKYHFLEQFEDSIENYCNKLLKNKEETYFDKIEDPFRYLFKIVKKNKLETINVDLIETFNYTLGIQVDKTTFIKENGRVYIIIIGNIQKAQVGVVWRAIIDIDLELDKKIIEKSLNDDKIDTLFVNGSCLIPNAKSIEAELNHLIFS